VIRVSVTVRIPPTPLHCMQCPISMSVIPFETAQRTAPTVKRTSANIRRGLRPNTWENAMKLGCQRVEAKRKEVPVQNASIELPWSAFEIA
jgi:hypothetical protein